jgi:hypothetical protein
MANVCLARLNPSDYEMVRGIINNDLPVLIACAGCCKAIARDDLLPLAAIRRAR